MTNKTAILLRLFVLLYYWWLQIELFTKFLKEKKKVEHQLFIEYLKKYIYIQQSHFFI